MPAVDQAPPALLVCRHLAPRSICPECIRAALAGVEEPDCEDCNDTGTIADPAPDAPGASPPESCVSCSPRTLPVTPAERACATVLRAWRDWPGTTGQPHQAEIQSALMAIGDILIDVGLASEEAPITPAGTALLARVEAAPVLEPTAAIVAFIRAEETRYRRNSWDSSHDAAGRERCANKASVLATVAAYIERGDHLAPPIDAPPAKEPR